ncbi:hypothetical protein [Brachyspira sp.]|uniref:hypothetical protein n=1 Tax=Brachyspira sp. TaxID=1977261 RepID=UPI003D7E10FA
MYNFKNFFTYVVVGALVMALYVSCKSNEDPSDGDGNGFNLDDIYTTSGDAATFFTGSYTFTGTLTRSSFSGISEDEASETLPTSMEVTVTINANKITVTSPFAQFLISSVQLNNGYDGIDANSKYNAGGESKTENMHNKEYIAITQLLKKNDAPLGTYVSITESAGVNAVSAITVRYQFGSIQGPNNFKGTYMGDLFKQ